jgi:flagellum-specific ATP synthase
MHTIQKDTIGQINFLDQALRSCRHVPVSSDAYQASVISFDGAIISTSALPCVVGALCLIENSYGRETTGEVVRIHRDSLEIIPHDTKCPIQIGDQVTLLQSRQEVDVGEELLGRVIDGLGNPLDQLPNPICNEKYLLDGISVNPFQRRQINQILDVGIRNMNALLTVGSGQRLGIMAGSGVGKSVLLSMITKNTSADVIVIALIGERGREVASFTHEILGSHSQQKVVIVAVPADRSPLLRIQGAKRATAICEYFRDQGKNVLLIMDSLTRVAHAQREVGLSLGEQPTSRGYPPSVISLLPSLIERTGTSTETEGAITAIYTVLADGDDIVSDPVVDTARAILDGHIVLSRELAQQGVYPAIDVGQSISRLMNDIVDDEQIKNANKLRRLISKYQENRDLVLMGGYVQGQDQDLDIALSLWPDILSFLQQDQAEENSYENACNSLSQLVGHLT